MKIPREVRNDAYERMLGGLMDEIDEVDGELFKDLSPDIKTKIVYTLTMFLLTEYTPEDIEGKTSDMRFRIYNALFSFMGELYPAEFERIFPIEKDFDGHKYECKDYFYTKKILNSMPQDKPIGEDNITRLLWDYQNPFTRELLVSYLHVIDDLRSLQGKPSMMEEFAQQNGIRTYTKFTSPNGREYMRDNDTGKTFRVRKPRPEHLRIVK